MPYLRLNEVAAASGVSTRSIAESTLSKSAGRALRTKFDVFLSHSMDDAQYVLGLKTMLEREGLSVYVDWIDDADLDRNKVTRATASRLRERMGRSNDLFYAWSPTSRESRWMPWELGWFDGHNPGHVYILPLVQSSDDEFKGQEYLGLYPVTHALGTGAGRHLEIFRGERRVLVSSLRSRS
jgi:hypothetical protein